MKSNEKSYPCKFSRKNIRIKNEEKVFFNNIKELF